MNEEKALEDMREKLTSEPKLFGLSKEDAYKMGFTLNEYLSVENYVKTLNQIKVLHK
mgnify:CR=1 FL=1